MKKASQFNQVLIWLSFILLSSAAASAQNYRGMEPQDRTSFKFMTETTINLTEWFIQSSAKLKQGGEQLSLPGIVPDRWYPAIVPSTILGTLVEDNVYQDVFFGKNLDKIKPEEFQVSWWYRTEFLVTPFPGKNTARLELDGVNYRANIWLNGQKVAEASEIYGAFRRFELNVTRFIKFGEKNVLAIEVLPPVPGEPSIGFVDWNPASPDHNMGLWRPVRLKLSGPVDIINPFVQSKLDTINFKEARLTVQAQVRNNSDQSVSGNLEVQIEKINLSQEVKLEPGEVKTVVFTPDQYKELVVINPRIWWTHDLGQPELYQLFIAFRVKPPSSKDKPQPKQIRPDVKQGEKDKGKEADKDSMKIPPQFRSLEPISDWTSVKFGLREIKDYLTEEGYKGYILNGKKILIRGGGYTDDIFLNSSSKRLRAELNYARHLNLNALRLEGFWGTSHELYNLCDELGLLLMVGWSCHWEWENYLGKPVDPVYGGIISPEDIQLISRSFRDQVLWLRHHPSIFVWALASDLVSKPELEKEYHAILKEIDPDRPFLNSTGSKVSPVSGPSGVKMNGPYDWVPPNYWYEDKKNGGAFGFNTETGPGPQVPVVESLRKMIPEEHLWPPDDVWYYHCCRGIFRNLDRYHQAMKNRLGWPAELAEYERKAQYLNYEAVRAMFEAFVARRPGATGVIHWMFNSAWPKLWWQLFDYYLMPTGAFYGARKACQPLHLIYDYETREVIVSNLSSQKSEKLKAVIKVLDAESREKYSADFPVELLPDSWLSLVKIPEMDNSTGVYFLDLKLSGPKGELRDENFYCLSNPLDQLDFGQTSWYVTPVKKYANLTALNSLPEAQVNYRWKVEGRGQRRNLVIELANNSPYVAFNLEIQVLKKMREQSVVPLFLDDNYFSLLPGDKRVIRGYFNFDDLEGDEVDLRIRGWNVRAYVNK
ncbi:MAG TPA: glycoside hydrolase family 2 TIM barrel-domain containing protein [Candidatus Saccharicenans sp.]|jgi:exo-1,4-beta-D-glucosaminidase|nr:glycoside hydrolase family 2 [Candidatus Saccharicenans sp.]HRD01736.1 glycoside hydrolase family 2 TIM barrel-domain containing protein [Candidatus Saccharicenans sp.]